MRRVPGLWDQATLGLCCLFASWMDGEARVLRARPGVQRAPLPGGVGVRPSLGVQGDDLCVSAGVTLLSLRRLCMLPAPRLQPHCRSGPDPPWDVPPAPAQP